MFCKGNKLGIEKRNNRRGTLQGILKEETPELGDEDENDQAFEKDYWAKQVLNYLLHASTLLDLGNKTVNENSCAPWLLGAQSKKGVEH